MKLAWVLLTTLVAVTLQVTLARFTVGGRWVFDLVLVGVVYSALIWGPVSGMLAGTIGGIIQDLLAGGIVGVGALVKTLVGYAAGVIGAQFVLAKPQARTIIVAAATVVHRLAVLGLNALIEQHWSGVPWAAILGETVLNGLAALVAFQALEAVPGAIERGRMRRRSTFTRRNW
jgi:rod shape-determining protein MreD